MEDILGRKSFITGKFVIAISSGLIIDENRAIQIIEVLDSPIFLLFKCVIVISDESCLQTMQTIRMHFHKIIVV